jgi:DNA-binding response OmpR family regulator
MDSTYNPGMGSKKRILVVDDNEDLRNTIGALLQADGFDVALAADGQAALAEHQATPADVVLTDLFMPDKDGIETIVELRRLSPQVKIVAMSGWTSTQGSDYLQVAREIGASVTLQKPFDPGELSRVLRRLVT